MSTSVLELNNLPTDGRSVFDGKASIEHQIEIYVTDLFDVTDKEDISLGDVIAGLRYVMDYRIRGLRMPHLEQPLMQRLAEGLILHMNQTDGHWLKKRLTQDANNAFVLFSEFLEEIDEFGDAIGKKEVSELRGALKLEKRARKDDPEELQKAAKSIVAHLTEYPQFSDWHDLVPEEHVDAVNDVLSTSSKALEKPKLPNKGLLRPPPALYFDRPPEAVLRMFRTSMNDGLPSTAIPDLADHYGKNTLPSPPKPSTLKMIIKQLTDFMVLILLAATITTAAIGESNSSIVLAVVILLNTVIGFTQEYKANKALEALTSLGVPMAQVIRDGRQEVIESAALVPGDVVVLEEGESVPADLRLVEVSQLEIVESILTGESVGVLKSTERIRARTRKLPLGDCKGSAFMSTVVSRGRGKGVVVRTGEQTEIGKISRAITRQPQQVTQIQRKLDKLGKWLVAIALGLSATIVVIGLAWKTDPNELLYTGIALAVSVIPEGLVAVVTVTMALGVRRMADKSAIVRTLSSVETLGSVTVVCSDKTGTLTEGKMGAAQLWTADDGLYSFTDSTSLDPNVGCAVRTSSNASKTHPAASARPIGTSGAAEAKTAAPALPVETPVSIEKNYTSVPSHLFTTLMISSLCNNAAVAKDAETSLWKGVGDPTEVALVVAAAKAGFPKEWFLEQHGFSKLGEQAFDSDRKLMSVVYAVPKAGVALVLAKGAPEEVLARCTTQLPNPPVNMKEPLDIAYGTAPGCTPIPLSDPFVHLVSDQSRRMADGGLRVLGLAMKCVPLSDSTTDPAVIAEAAEATCANPDHAEKDFSFTGLIGLIDPPRAGVKESVAKCNAAGVRVVMITGDHVATATAIATELGIFKPGVPNMCRAIKGVELDLLSDEAMADLNPFPNVFARVSPDNKLKIVQALQSRKHLAAMTGDGVNDAPAIKTADIGIAMGITGTEITKQAADIVLANDDFNTIVFAIEEGRRVYDNILKFCVYLLSCNFAEILLFLITACINVPMPFTTMMILWANIIADIPPAMSLGVEPQEKNIMKRKPRPKDEGVLTYMTATIVILQATVMSLTTVILYLIDLGFDKVFKGHDHGFPEQTLRDKQSLAFVTLTTMQLLQSFLSRSVYDSVFVTGVTGNRWMVGAFFLSYGLMLVGLFVEPIANFLSLRPVTGIAWVQVFAVFAFQLLCSELIKFGARRYRDRGVNTRRQQYEGVDS